MGISAVCDVYHLTHAPHSLAVKRVGLEAAREAARNRVLDVKYEPRGDTSLSEPKFGKVDPKNAPHTGGNTWAGGVGLSEISLEIR